MIRRNELSELGDLDELDIFVINYLRIDEDNLSDATESFLLDIIILSAKEYFSNAGVTADKEDKMLYRLGVALLAGHWWENRAVTTLENNTKLQYSLNHIVMQLKYCGDE